MRKPFVSILKRRMLIETWVSWNGRNIDSRPRKRSWNRRWSFLRTIHSPTIISAEYNSMPGCTRRPFENWNYLVFRGLPSRTSWSKLRRDTSLLENKKRPVKRSGNSKRFPSVIPSPLMWRRFFWRSMKMIGRSNFFEKRATAGTLDSGGVVRIPTRDRAPARRC